MTSVSLPPYIVEGLIDRIVRMALDEDVGTGDVTSLATIGEDATSEGTFLAKEEGVVAGLHAADRVFAVVDPLVDVRWLVADGSPIRQGDVIGRISGPARSVLTGERLALNLIQRMSGIATATRAMVEAVHPHAARILDTRKTVPGLRLLDKWAVLLGGGANHRVGLYDMILIKDNHIAACGSVSEAIRSANAWRRSTGNTRMEIEIEVRTTAELEEVLATGDVDAILLDNMVDRLPDGTFGTTRLLEAVRRIGGRFRTEASGNVTLASVQTIAATGVDTISSGALTHSVRALDVSLALEVNTARPAG